MLSVDRPSQGLSGGEMTGAHGIRWCANIQAARISLNRAAAIPH
jgi:hypothetical protein